MANPGRQLRREALAAHLKACVSACDQAAIFAYQIGDFGTLSPAMRVLSAGSERPKLTNRGRSARMLFSVQIWVLAVDPDAGWTEQQAEDALDACEQQVADAVDAGNHKTDVWAGLDIVGQSEVTREILGGKQYLFEEVTVAVTVL